MHWFLIAMLLAPMQAIPPVPRQAAGNPAQDSRNVANNSDEKGDAAPAHFLNKEGPTDAQGNSGNEASKSGQEHVIVDRLPDKDGWDKFYICLTAALVLIGSFTLGAIWYQARKTAEAAKAAADSVKLQEAAFRQWVIIGNWKHTHRNIGHGHPNELMVEFDVTNPTDYPLTFQQATIWVGAAEIHKFGSHLMAPHVPYTLDFSIPLSSGDDSEYANSTFAFGIRGHIQFVDVLRRQQTQPFGGLFSCNRTHATVFQPHSAYEESATEKGKTN